VSKREASGARCNEDATSRSPKRRRTADSLENNDSKVSPNVRTQSLEQNGEGDAGGSEFPKAPSLRREVSMVGKDEGWVAFDPDSLGPRSKSIPESDAPPLIRGTSSLEYHYPDAPVDSHKLTGPGILDNHEDNILPTWKDFKSSNDEFDRATSNTKTSSSKDAKVASARPTKENHRLDASLGTPFPSGFEEKRITGSSSKSISSTAAIKSDCSEQGSVSKPPLSKSPAKRRRPVRLASRIGAEMRRRKQKELDELADEEEDEEDDDDEEGASIKSTKSTKSTKTAKVPIERVVSTGSAASTTSAGKRALEALTALGIPIIGGD